MTSYKVLCRYFNTEDIGVWYKGGDWIPYKRLLEDGLVIEKHNIKGYLYYQLSDKGADLIRFGEL